MWAIAEVSMRSGELLRDHFSRQYTMMYVDSIEGPAGITLQDKRYICHGNEEDF